MLRAVLLVSIAFPAAVPTAVSAQQVSLTKAVRSGATSTLAFERAWDRSCAAIPAQVSITRSPEHGTISVASASSTIPASTPRSGSTGPCAGHRVTGNQVLYRSQPGFRGQDHVSWTATYGNGGGGTTDVDIDVR